MRVARSPADLAQRSRLLRIAAAIPMVFGIAVAFSPSHAAAAEGLGALNVDQACQITIGGRSSASPAGLEIAQPSVPEVASCRAESRMTPTDGAVDADDAVGTEQGIVGRTDAERGAVVDPHVARPGSTTQGRTNPRRRSKDANPPATDESASEPLTAAVPRVAPAGTDEDGGVLIASQSPARMQEETAPARRVPIMTAARRPSATPPTSVTLEAAPPSRPASGSLGRPHPQVETDIVHAAESAALVGLAIAPRVASDSWAVVLEVGKGGNGWAGAIVFNLWLRRQLRERRMTQRQLAARSGVNHSTISRLLSDNRKPSLDTAAKLVRAVQEIPSDDEVVRYLEALSLSSMLPTRRVEAALRGDEQLEDQDVQALMAAYLAARAKRRRAGDVDSGAERDHEHTA